MNRKRYELMKSVNVKDDKGYVKKAWEKTGEIRGSFLQPVTKNKNYVSYGYDGTFSYKVFTREAVTVNQVLKYESNFYQVKHVIPYPDHSILLLEVV